MWFTPAEAAFTGVGMRKTTISCIIGLLGLVTFSAPLPATRVAVAGLSPMSVTCGRAVAAAVLGGICLPAYRTAPPSRGELVRLEPAGVLLFRAAAKRFAP